MSLKAYILLVGTFLISLSTLTFGQEAWNAIPQVKDHKDQLKQYLKSYEGNENDFKLQSNIAEQYYLLNQIDEARSWFEKALSQIPLSTKHQFQYANTLMAMEDYSGAKNWFLLFAESNPNVGRHYAANIDVIEQMNKIAPMYGINSLDVNSANAELSPCINGNRLYFLSKSAYGTKLAYGDITTNGVTYKGEINTGINLNEVNSFSFSADRSWVVYTKQDSYPNQRQIPEAGLKSGIYIAQVRTDGGWVNSKAFTHNSGDYNVYSPSFTNGGNTIYFSSDRQDGFGGMDIYSSNKQGESWSFPINAGSVVNSPGHEIYPYHNGNSLFYSSNYHEGFGSYDVFRAEMQGTVGAKVFHQGKGINSSRDDFSAQFSPDGESGFVVSNKSGGLGLADIYAFNKRGEDYHVVVVDETHAAFIEGAEINMAACGGTVALTNDQGLFVFQLSNPGSCDVVVSKAGYQDTQVTVGKSLGTVYTVSMKKTDSAIASQGVVIDPNSGQGLAGVTISATERMTNQTSQVVSDQNGNFVLAIKPKNSYILSFEKAGYESLNKSISTGVDVSGNVLGVTPLIGVGANSGGAVVAGSNVNVPTTSTSASSGSSSYPGNSNSNRTNTANTFAVQVAAINPSKQIDMNSYGGLNAVGEVYVQNGSDYNRVRVGFFSTKEEAERAKVEVRNLGFARAYVVKQERAIDSRTSSVSTLPDLPDTTIDKSPQEFRIRLTALQNAQNFNYRTAEQFGRVETTQSNGFTVFYITDIRNENAGLSALRNLRSSGFPDAQLMVKKNGIFTKVQ